MLRDASICCACREQADEHHVADGNPSAGDAAAVGAEVGDRGRALRYFIIPGLIIDSLTWLSNDQLSLDSLIRNEAILSVSFSEKMDLFDLM